MKEVTIKLISAQPIQLPEENVTEKQGGAPTNSLLDGREHTVTSSLSPLHVTIILQQIHRILAELPITYQRFQLDVPVCHSK